MARIQQYGTLSAKERVQRTLHHDIPDRVPINYHSNPGVDARLKQAFGLRPDDHEGLCRALGVDFRGIGARYTGPVLHQNTRPDRQVHPLFGWVTRWVEHGSGGYWDYCDFPLRDAELEEIAAFPFPNPDDFDYEGLREMARSYEGYALHLGGGGTGCVINTAGFWRGMEQTLVDLITDDPALILIDHYLDSQFGILERELEAVHDLVDFVWMGEDLGTQKGPLISMALFEKQVLSRHRRFIDLAASYGLPVMLHTCGSSSWTYEKYIEAGLKGVDTLQPEATNMEPRYLKEHFDGRLFFHGCISTAGPIAFGTPQETVEYCRNTLEIMMPGGGYCFAPTHSLQDNSPTENVIAAYQTAHDAGRYR